MSSAKKAKKRAPAKGGKAARGGERRPDDAPPEKLYRPFEELAKAQKAAKRAKPTSDARPGETPAAGGPKGKSAASTPTGGGTARLGAHKPNSKTAPGHPTPGQPGAGGKHAGRAAEGSAMEPTDAESFAIYMAGVRELDSRATRIPRTASRVDRAEKGSLPRLDADAPARAELMALVVEGIRFETTDDGERIEGRRVEVEPREVRRLRRGQYTVDQQLDLHGLTVPEARKAIETFVEKRRKEGDRVVRLVHGKGGHSPRGVGALRGEIAAWLSQGPAKRHIAAFATAPPEEGGAGALLVLLMRPRA